MSTAHFLFRPLLYMMGVFCHLFNLTQSNKLVQKKIDLRISQPIPNTLSPSTIHPYPPIPTASTHSSATSSHHRFSRYAVFLSVPRLPPVPPLRRLPAAAMIPPSTAFRRIPMFPIFSDPPTYDPPIPTLHRRYSLRSGIPPRR